MLVVFGARTLSIRKKSEELDDLLQSANNVAVSVLCLAEIVSALCRRFRERFLTKSQYATAKAALESDLADSTVIAMADEVLLGGIRLLELFPLRTSDALQISSVLAWQAGVFVSADARQSSAAQAAGLKVAKL